MSSQKHEYNRLAPFSFPISRDVTMTDASTNESRINQRWTGYGGLSGSHSIGFRVVPRRTKIKRCPGGSFAHSAMSQTNHGSSRLIEPLLKPCEMGKKIDFLSCLPYELGSHIISYLDLPTLLILATVSRTWNTVYKVSDVWRMKTIERNWKVNSIPPELRMDRIDWHYLFKQRYQLEQRWRKGSVLTHYLIGHKDSVYCLQFDKHKIVTGSRDKTIKFWDMATYSHLQTLEGHEASVLCLQYNEHIMVSGSSDTTIIVWDMYTCQPRMRLRGHKAGVLDVSFDDRYIVSCSKDTSIRIWDINTGALLRTIMAHQGPVNSVQLQNNNIVSASGDALIKMWDVTTGACIRQFVGHTRGLACVQYKGNRIVSGSNDKTIRVWDADTGKCLMVCKGHTDLVRTLDFDDERIVSASYDQSIRVWDIKTGDSLLNFQSGHSSWVLDVHFDKNRVVSASQDKRILIMDFSAGLDTHLIT
ncbi:WD40-repeat-containing domain protein [Phycomyces blakesleeanus]